MAFKSVQWRWVFLFWILAITSIAQARSKFDQKHVTVAMRMIGHRVLLNSNDSTSRVLPIEHQDNRYIISFESPVEIEADDLYSTVNDVFLMYEITSAYILEVVKCNSEQVLYSYEMDYTHKSDLVPCRTRNPLPKACYQLIITLNGEILAKDELDEKKARADNGTYVTILFGAIILMAGIFFKFRKKRPSKKNPNLIEMGAYQFNKGKGELVLDGLHIELTGKENDLLALLYQSVNNTVKREEILHEVWGDEGDYVGRTLDVFISKLRKKLEANHSVKIANIRGVGYKLVVENAS